MVAHTKAEMAELKNLKDGLNAYRCLQCDHLVGDTRERDTWVGQCPPEEKGGCHERTVFKRVE
jgi:hypothetical protein